MDGCFWHGCTRCARNITPSTNRKYWSEKIVANRKRDRRADRNLRDTGYHVLRIWEHDLEKRPDGGVGGMTHGLVKEGFRSILGQKL